MATQKYTTTILKTATRNGFQIEQLACSDGKTRIVQHTATKPVIMRTNWGKDQGLAQSNIEWGFLVEAPAPAMTDQERRIWECHNTFTQELGK